MVRLEPAQAADFERLFEIRLQAMRASLERLGRYDPERARSRFRASFRPEYTSLIIDAAGTLIGCVALGPRDGTFWLEHFYLKPHASGQGIGGHVMRRLLAEVGDREVIRLDVLLDSDAKRFYERFGFRETHRDAIDVFMERTPVAALPLATATGSSGREETRRPGSKASRAPRRRR